MAGEEKTIGIMVRMYCRSAHAGGSELCAQCRELSDYCLGRLEKCVFKKNKPVCARCRIHCYTPPMREKITAVMRFCGPRLALRHPFLAVAHFLRSRCGPGIMRN